MTINNLRPALELWDNGFNVIPVKSKPITPTPENPSEDKGLFKQPLKLEEISGHQSLSRGLIQMV